MGANLAHQPLGQSDRHGIGHQKGISIAHVEQAGHHAYRIVGMDGGKDDMPGQGGLDGHAGGFRCPGIPLP